MNHCRIKPSFAVGGLPSPTAPRRHRLPGYGPVKGQQGRFNLMGVEINLRVHTLPGKFFNTVRRAALG